MDLRVSVRGMDQHTYTHTAIRHGPTHIHTYSNKSEAVGSKCDFLGGNVPPVAGDARSPCHALECILLHRLRLAVLPVSLFSLSLLFRARSSLSLSRACALSQHRSRSREHIIYEENTFYIEISLSRHRSRSPSLSRALPRALFRSLSLSLSLSLARTLSLTLRGID